MSSESVISLKDVDIFQGNNLILDDVNLEIKKGDFIYIIGRTGSGKSSLLKVLYADVANIEHAGLIARDKFVERVVGSATGTLDEVAVSGRGHGYSVIQVRRRKSCRDFLTTKDTKYTKFF